MLSGHSELVPLYSLEAEMSTLGAMILSERAAEEVITILDEDDFYRPAHRLIFKAIRQLMQEHKVPDLLTISEELKARGVYGDIGGEDYLVQIAEYVVSPANSNYYAQIVLDKATMRRLEAAGRDIVGVVHDPDAGNVGDKVDKAEQILFEVGRKQLGSYFRHVRPLAKEFFLDIDRLVETREPIHGLATDFVDLDRKTTGFYPGDFIIVGGRPAMGKTSLVMAFAVNVAQRLAAKQERGSVAIFSLEMSSIQLTRRMVSLLSRVSSHAMRSPKLNDWQYEKLSEACADLYEMPVFIDDSSDVTPLEMRGKCRRLKAEHGLSLVIVDYLQLMRGSRRTENRVQEISEIARGCKAMAKELEVPVIALSQLSRTVEHRDDKRPQLSDLRESGSIEAEADLVMLLYRESYYKAKEENRAEIEDPDEAQEAEIIIAKHRNGPTGKVKVAFQPAYARFSNIDHSESRVVDDDE